MKPITIKPTASPFPPAMKILLALYLCFWDVGGNINYYRSPRLGTQNNAFLKPIPVRWMPKAPADSSTAAFRAIYYPDDHTMVTVTAPADRWTDSDFQEDVGDHRDNAAAIGICLVLSADFAVRGVALLVALPLGLQMQLAVVLIALSVLGDSPWSPARRSA